jgi:hypothetical protein
MVWFELCVPGDAESSGTLHQLNQAPELFYLLGGPILFRPA